MTLTPVNLGGSRTTIIDRLSHQSGAIRWHAYFAYRELQGRICMFRPWLLLRLDLHRRNR